MARAAPPGLVPAKMYRHFAVVTVALTFCLAIFANGSEQNAIQNEIAAKQSANQLKKAEKEKAAKKSGGKNQGHTFVDNRTTKGSWGSDAGVSGFTGGFADDSIGPELVPEVRESIVGPAITQQAPPVGMTTEEWQEQLKRSKLGKPAISS